ncbi:porin family protein [Halopseudomonas maritima]|uniref:porin family protein n=1 Tax=Halopseudomonas maritima TaxID=2918528 RepID=UPI001EEA0401|nr:porin family protein [Halopseudomonas maritima]UJJ32811.1 porin family protein [Halopseudomonas maritima]
MFKKTWLAAALVGFSSVSPVILAQEAQPYIFASVGQSDADLPKSDIDNYWGVAPGVATSSLDTKDTAWKIGAGLKLNQYFAFEAEYLDLGEAVYTATDGVDVARTTVATEGYGLNGVLTLPLDAFSLFAKLGYHRLETEGDFTFSGVDVQSTSDQEWIWSWGVGAGYNFTESLAVVAEFERYRDVADYYDLDLMSAGLRYSF